jgi:hypothetical protein
VLIQDLCRHLLPIAQHRETVQLPSFGCDTVREAFLLASWHPPISQLNIANILVLLNNKMAEYKLRTKIAF